MQISQILHREHPQSALWSRLQPGSIFKVVMRQRVWLTPKTIGMALLAASVLINSVQIYWGNFPDEGDNIAAGLLMTKGYVLYRDIFSHHFPLPYHWAAIVISLMGATLTPLRGSLLLFQASTFWLAQRYSKFYLPIGLTALIWSLIGSVYFHNLFLYQNFKSLSLFFVVVSTFAVTGKYITLRTDHALLIGIFSVFALFSDPLAIYVVGAVILALLLSTRNLKQIALILLIVASAFLVYGAYLQAAGALTAFWDDVIHFNTSIYSKYTSVDRLPIKAYWRQASHGLHIVDARWLDFDPLRPLDKYNVLPDRWFFTGFLYRASVLLLVVALLYRRKYGAALFLYLACVLSLGARNQEILHANHFILVALFAGTFFITTVLAEMKRQFSGRSFGFQQAPAKGKAKSAVGIVLAICALVMAALYGWLGLRGAGYIVDHRDQLSYSYNFTYYRIVTREIRQLTCNQPDIRLGFYPANPLLYFFSKILPVSKYLFLWPWVADKGLDEIIAELQSTKAIVYVDPDADVWGYKTRDYLAPLIQYLEQNYIKVKTNIYLSPEIARRCPP